MSLAVLLLAAGRSSRMGQPKQSLPWGDTTLLGHAARQALPVADQLFVVLGAYQESLLPELSGLSVSIVTNPGYAEGLGSSLARGAAAVADDSRGFTHVLVVLADQPSVDTAYLRELSRTAARAPERIVATAYGERAGVPAVFPSSDYAELRVLGGDAGAGALLRKHAERVTVITPAQPIYDIDTPAEYTQRYEGDQKHH